MFLFVQCRQVYTVIEACLHCIRAAQRLRMAREERATAATMRDVRLQDLYKKTRVGCLFVW
jgi:hypothetical protein